MDLEEWEVLPDDGFLEIHDDDGKKIFSRKYRNDRKSVFQMNYFICPSPTSQHMIDSPQKSRVPIQLVPVPIQLEPTIGKTPDHEAVKEIIKIPIDFSIAPSPITEKIKAHNIGDLEADQDPVSQVFFRKTKETEFADMKMDSPKSCSRGIIPQIDAGTFKDKSDQACKAEAFESKNSSLKIQVEEEMVTKKNSHLDSGIQEEVIWEESNGGLNLWKWSLTGVGAICSFGVAAATLCIVIFQSKEKQKASRESKASISNIYQ
ncbi:unnamed protein product [Ilex paraguariensis]|uniref:DUF6821 domain-containing protein n=1 Tax=Ilex paraguariensis TaxID=185542 RepID=A0ABC8RY26_9AQUA